MKIVRSIVAVLVGVMVIFIVVTGAETINFAIYRPDDGRSFAEQLTQIQEDKKAMRAWVESLPQSAMLNVLLGWQLGAFLGGGLAAVIAGRARLLHAGLIGVLLLALTIANFFVMKRDLDFSHPDWMIVIALLLPLPLSLLAGKIVSLIFPPPPTPVPPS